MWYIVYGPLPSVCQVFCAAAILASSFGVDISDLQMRDQVAAKPERNRETWTPILYSASLELAPPKGQGSAGSGATCSNTLFPGASYCINRPSFVYPSFVLSRLN